MFLMQRLGNVERPPDMDEGTLTIYNKMHADYSVSRMGHLWVEVQILEAREAV